MTFALALVAASAVLLLVPMKAHGLSGSALFPHYTRFGWFSYTPLPSHPTNADFARAGIVLPQSRVHQRRELAASFLVGAVVVGAAAGAAAAGARRRPAPLDPAT